MEMNEEAKSCYLISSDEMLLSVYLPHQTYITLGRCPETNITDTQCSREQVKLYADYHEYKVIVEQIGRRPCGFNGFKTREGVKLVGKHNDRLEVLYGKYAYEIEFNPPPPKIVLSEKRPRDLDVRGEVEGNCFKFAKLEDGEANLGSDKEKAKAKELKKAKKSAKHADGILKFLQKNTMADETNGTEDLENEQDIWEIKESGALLIYTSHGVEDRSKVAAYDMDGTLIKTKSGLVFPIDYSDWQLIYPVVSSKLKELHNSGYKIVIFTNQGSIGSGKSDPNSFRNKLKNVIRRIGVPIQAFVATGNSIYRKPAIGMWQKLQEKNSFVTIDKDSSFYVGDAAGRAKNWAPGKKKDHSSVDRLLALNLGLKFYTPEEHFLGHKQAPYALPVFNPKNIPNPLLCSVTNINMNVQEIVLMVGCPGSGKSHFVKNYLNHYGYVNRDSLGSWQKCISMMEKHLIEKRSVVIDNTNPNVATRQRYIEIAKKRRVPVRCFVMSTSIDRAKHNNKFRELTDPSHVKINEIIINSYVKSYESPSLDEGFTEIVTINFVPKFQKEEDQRLYEMYLLERYIRQCCFGPQSVQRVSWTIREHQENSSDHGIPHLPQF